LHVVVVVGSAVVVVVVSSAVVVVVDPSAVVVVVCSAVVVVVGAAVVVVVNGHGQGSQPTPLNHVSPALLQEASVFPSVQDCSN
jgi:hypothetical protein